ncbi:nucleoside hydrolase [Pseudoalteromonas luteoviolacea]|uniref:nucleoside hydrolase n=1 Tax=Pseudoalteromonas luteoviolacea TaxID=43657 RepID=UPI0032B4F434
MKKIIFDTDPGIDDAMALLLAHASQEIDVIGITTTFGNASIENTTRNALFLNKVLGCTLKWPRVLIHR